MKAKRFSMAVALFCQFLLCAFISPAFGQSNVNVTLPDTSADAGASIAIPIAVEDVTGKGIYSVGLRLTYGSSVLLATGATTNGTIASGWGAPTANPGTGEVTIGMAGTSPLSGSGVLVYVNFNVVGSLGATTTIHFAEMTFNEGSPGAVSHDGPFRVNGGADNPVLVVSPTTLDFGTTATQKSFNISNGGGGTLTWSISESVSWVTKVNPSSGTGNHTVDVTVSRSGLNGGSYTSTIAVASNGGNQDVTVKMTVPGGNAEVNVTIPDTSAAAGTSINMPIRVDDVTGKGIYSLGIKLIYSSSVLIATGATTDGTIASGWGSPTANSGTGQITIGMAGSSPLSGSGILVYVNFNVVGSPGATTTIHFAEMTFNEGAPGAVTRDEVFSVDGVPPNVTMKFDPPAHTVNHPCSFPEDVVIDSVENMGAFQFGLQFDPSKLQVDKIELGDFLASTGNTASPVGPTIDNENGEATFGGFSFGANPGPSGSGCLAMITFTTKDTAKAGTPLRFQDVTVTDKEGNAIEPVNVEEGIVTITSCYLYDIDCDGDVDIIDIQLVAAKWGAKCGDPDYDPCCDIDNDCDIDVVDIQKVAAHWGEKAPFSSILAKAFADGSADDLTVSITPSQVEAIGSVQVSVTIDQVENLGAFEFDLGYSPEIVHVEDVQLGDFLGSTGNTAAPMGPTIDNTTGKVTFGAFSFGANPGPSGSGTLAAITFTPVGNGTSSIDFLSIQVTDKEGQVLTVSGSNPGLITDVEEQKDVKALPQEYSLGPNFPNPFNPATEISYRLPEASDVQIAIYNLLGQEVRRLVDARVEAGCRSVLWDGRDSLGREVGSGVYLVQMKAKNFVLVRKMLLLR